METCLTFLNTTANVYQALDVHFARYELSTGKFTILMKLLQVDEQGLTPSECAEKRSVTTTITGLFDGLERKKLVIRKPYPSDRRVSSIYLTDKGHELLSQMLPNHFCRTTNLMANLTDTDYWCNYS